MMTIAVRRLICISLCACASTALLGCSILDTIWGKKIKLSYCEDNPSDPDCRNAFPDGGDDRCTSNASCVAPTAVCDLAGSMTCVQCVAPDQTAACGGTTPVCGADHTCQACSMHTDCPVSNVCLPDGSCANKTDVAYVQQGGTGTMCTKDMPCGTLAEGLGANRPLIKMMTGTAADSKTTTIDGRSVTILADPGAKLDMTGDGVILEIRNNGADVKIYDLEITGGTGKSTDAAVSIPNGGAPKLALTRVTVDGNQGLGISSSGGTLAITQSTISSNQGAGISSSGSTLTIARSTISSNQGGGIFVTGGVLTLSQSDIALNFAGGISVSGPAVTFDITNNFVYRNGDPDNGTFGGLMLGIAAAGGNRMEFNTIVDNRSAINSGGVVCNAPAFSAPNNIIARNFLGTSTTAPAAQTSLAGCSYPTSIIQNDVSGLGFVKPEAPAPFDYRITSTSVAKDQALTPSAIVIDHDGHPRPIGPQKDIGASEYNP